MTQQMRISPRLTVSTDRLSYQMVTRDTSTTFAPYYTPTPCDIPDVERTFYIKESLR